jgi:putative transcriptional regulator
MRLSLQVVRSVAAFVVLIAGATGAVRAADLSEPVLLVATARLAGSGYAETVLVAAPLEAGHIGFIVNRPTGVKLQALFPEDAPSSNVVDSVYLGGPEMPSAVIAVTRKAPGGGIVVPLMPDLFAVFDSATVDRVISTTPNDARYFVGLVVWMPGELEKEIRAGAWDVRPADADTVFRTNAPRHWKGLRGTMANSDTRRHGMEG